MTFDPVNRPSHYAEGRLYEPIAVIEDWQLDYHLGNALKYISRAGRKLDTLEDLKKAVWYLNRRIEVVEAQNTTIEEEENNPRSGWEVPAADVDDQELIYTSGELWYWDSDEDWMVSPAAKQADTYEHSAHYYDFDRNGRITGQEECGWDPSVGPTC